MTAAEGGLDLARVLLQFAVVVLAAKLAGEAFERMRQPAVLGELVAGLLLGPSLFGLLPNVFDPPVDLADGASAGAIADLVGAATNEAVILFLAEIGAIILLFEVGLESHLRDLVSVGRAATVVAIVGILASIALGYGASWALAAAGYLPDRALLHVFVGATFAATSVGITARVLKDLGRLASTEARIILGAAVLDDVGGLLVLAIVSGLATAAETGAGFSVVDLAVTTLIAFGFLVASLAIGLKVVAPLFGRLRALRVRGVVISFAFLLAVVLAFLAAEAGLATIVGAFAAGLILSQTKEHYEVFTGVKPLGDVFIPFFFVVMGAAVDVRQIGSDAGLILLVSGVLLVAAVVAKLLCGLGLRKGEGRRWIVGAGMVPRGEVGLIFVVFGVRHLAIEPWVSAALILVVMATTVVTPVWLRALYRNVPPERAVAGSGEHRDDIGRRDADDA